MGRNKKDSGVSREERMVISIAEIIQELISAHQKGKDVNLNKMKTRIASKYGLETSPRLVDIIAAVPAEYKKILLPKLKAKPIRTASGIQSDTDENIQYIVVHPKLSPMGKATNVRRRRPRWKHWETQAVLDVMKSLNMGNKQNRKRDNFVAVEREIKKRGISRWNWEQIQQKWHNLRKDWINSKSGLNRNGSTRALCEFESELDELLECDTLNWTVPARKVYRQVKVLSYKNIEDASELTDAEAMGIDENVQGEGLPTAMLEDATFLAPSHSLTTSMTDDTADRKRKKGASKGTGSYSAALSTFASVICARQESIMKMMTAESSRAAEEEFRQQQEHDKCLVREHTTFLSTQLANIMAENTQTILHGMASMMGLYLPLSQDMCDTENNS